jgi:hypothetical protein
MTAYSFYRDLSACRLFEREMCQVAAKLFGGLNHRCPTKFVAETDPFFFEKLPGYK